MKTGRWTEYPVSVRELPSFIRTFPKLDSYISQNRFQGKRRKVALLNEAGAMWADLDFYKIPELTGLHPFLVFEEALHVLLKARIPEPSLAISSGRGLYLIWLHEPIEIDDLSRWNACQYRIWSALRPLGADPAVKHSASVLRIVGSTNSKAGKPVEVLTGSEDVWDFEDLSREILPDRKSNPTASFLLEASRRRQPGYFALNNWNGGTLWAGRYGELRKLIYHRWPHGIPQGYRDTVLFLGSVSLSWIVEPSRIETEIRTFASMCRGNWRQSDTAGTITTTIRRSIQAARGETVIWKGEERDPRYRYSSDRLAEMLGITPDEARSLDLRHLIPAAYSRERRAIREQERRSRKSPHTKPFQSQGYRSHTDSEQKRKPWEALGISRATYYRQKGRGLETPAL